MHACTRPLTRLMLLLRPMCEAGLRYGTKEWGRSIFNRSRWLVATFGWGLSALTPPTVQAAPSALECYPASDLERMFEDGYGTPARQPGDLSLAGLRGETLSAQCGFLAHEDVEGLSVSVGPLRQPPGDSRAILSATARSTSASLHGETIPVAPDGLFLAQIPPSAEGKIIFDARGKGQFRNVEVQSVPTSNR